MISVVVGMAWVRVPLPIVWSAKSSSAADEQWLITVGGQHTGARSLKGCVADSVEEAHKIIQTAIDNFGRIGKITISHSPSAHVTNSFLKTSSLTTLEFYATEPF